MIFFLGVVLVLLAIGLLALALAPHDDNTGVARSLAVLQAMTDAPKELREDLDKPFAERVVVPMQERALSLGRRLSAEDAADRIRRKLELAGNPAGWNVDRVISGKVIMAVTGEALALGVAHGLDAATLSQMMAVSTSRSWATEICNPWPGRPSPSTTRATWRRPRSCICRSWRPNRACSGHIIIWVCSGCSRAAPARRSRIWTAPSPSRRPTWRRG